MEIFTLDREVVVDRPIAETFAFGDQQLKGPYQRWVHSHEFEDLGDCTRVLDHVEYAVPGGSFVERQLVRPELERIFDYRTERLLELLGDGRSESLARS